MQIRWLGWAGAEIESDGETLVIDPLADATATFAPLGEGAQAVELPQLVSASGEALAGLVTHLHRDHADADALTQALRPGAPVFEPKPFGGEGLENLALAQADAELDAAGFERTKLEPWQTTTRGPFTITALPAADGLGDPQVSWLVEARGRRVAHLGDTIYHGYWWRIAQRYGPIDAVMAPINAPQIEFPHRTPASPIPAALDPEQAVLVGELLGAEIVIPIHYDGFRLEPFYRPLDDARGRFVAASNGRGRVLEVGETLELV